MGFLRSPAESCGQERSGWGKKVHTDLRPRELGQAADELRRGVDAEPERLFVDDLADAVPEGGFETLLFAPERWDVSDFDYLSRGGGEKGAWDGWKLLERLEEK